MTYSWRVAAAAWRAYGAMSRRYYWLLAISSYCELYLARQLQLAAAVFRSVAGGKYSSAIRRDLQLWHLMFGETELTYSLFGIRNLTDRRILKCGCRLLFSSFG